LQLADVVDVAGLGMPDIPGRPAVRDKGGGRGVEVTWNGLLPNNTGSVLYLVQRRSLTGSRHAHRQQHHGLDNNNTLTSPWQQIEQVNTFVNIVFRS